MHWEFKVEIFTEQANLAERSGESVRFIEFEVIESPLLKGCERQKSKS